MSIKQFFIPLFLLACAVANAQLTVDPSFNPSDHGGGKHNGTFGGDWGVNLGLILPNGKILTGGFYGFMHNQSNQGVSLLNQDGSIDNSFLAPGINDDLNDGVTAMVLQSDGKIILGGFMATYLGQSVHHILRINPNGSIDTSFHVGIAFNVSYYDVPRSFAIQTDGKIIVGGEFKDFDGNNVN